MWEWQYQNLLFYIRIGMDNLKIGQSEIDVKKFVLILKGMTHLAWNSGAVHVGNSLMQKILQNILLV